MKNFLSILVLSASLFAQQNTTLDTKGLTEDQIKVLNAAAEQLRKKPENTIENLSLQTTPDKFKEWAGVGEMAGKEIAAFTKGVGIAADQFLKTDTGKIAMYSVIWKFGGNKVVGSFIEITLKFLLAVVLYTFWWKLVRRFVFNERKVKNITYNENTFLRWLGFNKKEVKIEKDDAWLEKFSESDRFWLTLWTRVGAGVAIVLITIFSWPNVNF